MPWSVRRDSRCPVSKPFAVVLESDDSIEGCHESRSKAREQQAALYASEGRKAVGFVPHSFKAFVEAEHPRDPAGKWTDKPGAGVAKAWDWADDETRYAVQEIAPGGDKPYADRWGDMLPSDQRAALEDYAIGGYKRLNPKLRDAMRNKEDLFAPPAVPLTSDEQEQVDLIRKAIASAGEYPENQRPIVWRGVKMGPDNFMGSPPGTTLEGRIAEWAKETFKPGDEVQLGGFQSTSFSPLPGLNAAMGKYTPGVMFEIRAKGGAPLWNAGQHFDDEYELLLSDETKYRVVKVLPTVKFESTDYGDTVERTVIQLEQL